MSNEITGSKLSEVTTYVASNPDNLEEEVRIIEMVSSAGATSWKLKFDDTEFTLHDAAVETNRKVINIWYSQDDEPTKLTIEREI